MTENADHEKFRTLCRSRGIRCTPQRFAVYRFIHGNGEHPDVDTIWGAVRRELPSITRESVFRILLELADLGVTYRMDRIINARFDGRPHDHGHLICDRCGKITDFELSATPQVDSGNFVVDHVELRVSGLCAGCAAEVKQEKKRQNAASKNQ